MYKNLFASYNITKIEICESGCGGGHAIKLFNDRGETAILNELSTKFTKALLIEFNYRYKTVIRLSLFEKIYGKENITKNVDIKKTFYRSDFIKSILMARR